MEFPAFETPRLSLRRIAESDAPDLLKFFSDPQVMRYYDCEAIADLEGMLVLVRRFEAWFAEGTGFRWGLALKDSPKLIGTCGFFHWYKPYRVATIGYEMARQHHHKGLMREALRPLLAYAFGEMDLNRIRALVHTANEPSCHTLEHFGFQREGLLRQAQFVNGKFDDLYAYALLREEYRPQ